jgi:hypothetical protein
MPTSRHHEKQQEMQAIQLMSMGGDHGLCYDRMIHLLATLNDQYSHLDGSMRDCNPSFSPSEQQLSQAKVLGAESIWKWCMEYDQQSRQSKSLMAMDSAGNARGVL